MFGINKTYARWTAIARFDVTRCLFILSEKVQLILKIRARARVRDYFTRCNSQHRYQALQNKKKKKERKKEGKKERIKIKKRKKK